MTRQSGPVVLASEYDSEDTKCVRLPSSEPSPLSYPTTIEVNKLMKRHIEIHVRSSCIIGARLRDDDTKESITQKNESRSSA